MNKLTVLLLLFCTLLSAILVKLFYIQVLAQEQYFTNNYLRTERITPERGVVYDRNMEPLVLNDTTYLLTAEPKKIENREKTLDKLTDVLKLSDDEQSTVSARLESGKSWVSLKSALSQDQKDALMKLQLDGIGFTQESRRFYPEGSAAAHLLGFVGKTSDGDDTGYFGVEGYYDKDLGGLPGLFKTERDLFGKPIFIGIQEMVRGENGRNLVLTIDKNVQRIAKTKLKEGVERYGAKEGCVIAAEPYSGEILAMTCLPDFDPENYKDFSEDFFKNSAVTSLYEPGSIFKPLVMAAAINEGVLKPDDLYQENGPVNLGGYTINTWDDKYEGEITMTRILEKSSNVGMVYVGEKLGKKNLLSYLEKYGIAQKTGIDVQGESRGILKAENKWYPIDYATATFGQGIVVSPIRMIMDFAALINGGYIMKPHVVKSMISPNGQRTDIKPMRTSRIITEKTSLLIRKMLENTVEHAEAKWKKPKGYRIGGKTGTAQIPVEGHYDPSKTVASFIGFAPVDKPRFIIMVVLRETTSSPWGSETAAPIFFEIAKELLVYYNIAPN